MLTFKIKRSLSYQQIGLKSVDKMWMKFEERKILIHKDFAFFRV